VEVNIKIAKTQLIRGLWMCKFDVDKAIDAFLYAVHAFDQVFEDDMNYFGANCYLEIGSQYLKKNDAPMATAFVFKSHEIFLKRFGDEHPVMQKYYSYSGEIAAASDDNEMMLAMAASQLSLCEEVNKTKDGKSSVFVLDPIVSKVSMMSQAKEPREKVDQEIEKVDLIAFENGIFDGSQLQHSAYTVKAMNLIRQEKFEEALEVLQRSYEKQVKVFKGQAAHPFMEHSISQLGLLYKLKREMDKAEEMYGHLIKIKELYYGEESEALVSALKQMAVVQYLQSKFVEAHETLDRALAIGNQIKLKGSFKDKKTFGENLILLNEQKASMLHGEGKDAEARSVVLQNIATAEELLGSKNKKIADLAVSLFKVQVGDDPKDNAELYAVMKKGVEIEEESKGDLQSLSTIYYLTGTVASRLVQYQEAHDYFTKALETQKLVPNSEDRTTEIEGKLEQTESKLTGSKSRNMADKSDNFLVDVLIAGALVSVVVGLSTFAVLKLRNQ